MRKVSEVLQLLKDHPDYLRESEEGCHKYLCGILGKAYTDGEITNEEREAASLAIYNSLGGRIFLRNYLITAQEIESGTSHYSYTYRAAAHKHWADLIEKLQDEGE